MERRLAAILAADVVGYSHLTEVDEESSTATLRSYCAIANDVIAAHRGRTFSSAGDSIVAEFPSVVEAVRCAVEVQHEIADRNAARSEDTRMQFRIGINLGDVIAEGTDLYGTGVNVAARLEGLAKPGGICISQTVYDHVRKIVELSIEDFGKHRVKNIEEPVQVYRILLAASERNTQNSFWFMSQRKHIAAAVAAILVLIGGISGWYFLTRQQAPGPPLSIAVLPLVNLSGDPTQDYFSDGLTDDLITDLSKFSNLFVIASHSAFAYKGKSLNVRDIGRELSVRYLLEGSVQRSGNKLRINAQLVDSTTGYHLWAERYERNAEDIFSLQDEILETVLAKLEVQFQTAELDNAKHRETSNMNAYDLWLQGRAIFNDPDKETPTGRDEARAKFNAALDIDPSYARAKAGLAYTHIMDWDNEWTEDPDASLEAALSLAKEAVSLDDKDYYTHWILAIVYSDRDEFDAAVSGYERAIAIDDKDPNLLAEWGMTLTSLGRNEEAIARINQAIELNRNATPYWYYWALGRAYYMAKQYRKAIDAIELIDKPANYVRLAWAASYAQLALEAASPPDQAEVYKKKAKLLIEEYVRIANEEGDPVWTIEKAQSTVYKNKADLNHWVDGLRKAGLPEN